MEASDNTLRTYTSRTVTSVDKCSCGALATTLVCCTTWGVPSLDKMKLVCVYCCEEGEQEGYYRRLS